jgi:sirohydrochlorin ferrochelatase
MPDALVIAAHGSRDESGVAEFAAFAEAWQQFRPDRIQEAGFLEFARPTIGEAIDRVVEQGATRVVVMPAMLLAAGHVKNDVPSEVQEARSRHPKITFHMGRALDIHPALLDLCHLRYSEAIAHRSPVPAEETALVLVGRGTSDPDANANIARA